MATKSDLNFELHRIIEKSWEGNEADRGIKLEFLHLEDVYPASLDVINERQYADNLEPTSRQYYNKRLFCRTFKKWVPDYSSPQAISRINYNIALTDKYYFCRFGYTYALEYATLYQLVFLDMMSALQQNNPKGYIQENAQSLAAKHINVLSLGSGSLIDLFGMCFAKAVLDSPRHPLFMLESYTGYDLCEWRVKFDTQLLSQFFINNGRPAIMEHLGNDGNVIDAFGPEKTIEQNIIIFPKIINELDEEDFSSLVDAIELTDFSEDEYYICFSHNKSDNNDERTTGLERSKKIAEAVSRGRYNINTDILGDARNDILTKLYNNNITDTLETVESENNSIAYSFEETNDRSNYNNDYDSTFNGNFKYSEEENKFLSYCFDPLMDQIKEDYDIPDRKLRNVTTHAAGTIVFQIIKLTKRGDEVFDPYDELF